MTAEPRHRREVQIDALDMTQLRVLATLYRERSVRRTAERLCLTSSAISHALARLRVILDDELFVRQPDGMFPTARATDIAPKVQDALDFLKASLNEPEFDARTSERAFRLASIPYVASTLLPGMMAGLMAKAPGTRLVIGLVRNGLVGDLDSGRVDLAIGAFGRLPDPIERLVLMRDHFVIAMSRRHPLAGAHASLRDLMESAHVDIRIGDSGAESLDAYQVKSGLERKVMVSDEEFWKSTREAFGIERKVGVVAPDATTALAMIARTDLVGLVPASAVAASFHAEDLRLIDLPEPLPLTLELVWHRRKNNDRALAWLRDQIAAYFHAGAQVV